MAEATLKGQREVIAKLTQLERSLNGAPMGRVAFAAGEAIRSYMVRNYLSGQRLRRRTGKLASSFSTRIALGGRGAIMGTNTIYAPIHEFGYDKVQNVRGPSGTYQRHMRLRERKYFRDAIKNSTRDQTRAMAVAFERLVRSGA